MTLLYICYFVFIQVEKFLPRYQRKKVLKEQQPPSPPAVFEIIPNSGTLSPGEQVNIHIHFRPTEGVNSFLTSSWDNMNNCLNDGTT